MVIMLPSVNFSSTQSSIHIERTRNQLFHINTPPNGDRSYAPNFDLMPDCSAICTGVARSSYGLIFFKVILVAGAKQVGRTTMLKRLAESDINLQAFFEFDIYEQMA